MSKQESVPQHKKLSRAKRGLFRTIAKRCHGKTLILGHCDGDLSKVISGFQSDVTELSVSSLNIPGINPKSANIPYSKLRVDDLIQSGESFNTVVLEELRQDMSPESLCLIFSRAWQLLRPGGRLILSVLNQDCLPKSDRVRQFKRRNLTRLLRSLGTPNVITQQPLNWLLMDLTKDTNEKPRVNRSNRARFRVTSKLCFGRVIELGCGEGHLTKMISDRGLEVIGVDMNSSKILRAREQYPEITFMRSDICDLQLADSSFDTAILAEVLEHMPEDKGNQSLSLAWNLIRPGGRLIVSVPNEDCIPHPNHIRCFSLRSLKKLLSPLGKPNIVTDQPYKWLMMYVDKKS